MATKDVSKLDVVAEQGLMQCHAKNYAAPLAREHYLNKVYCFGIGFCRKQCRIKMSIWQRTDC